MTKVSSLLFNQLLSWLSSVIVDSLPKNVNNDDEIKLVRNVDRYYSRKKPEKVTNSEMKLLDNIQIEVRAFIEYRFKEFYGVEQKDELVVEWYQLLPFFVLLTYHLTKERKDLPLEVKFGHFNYKQSCNDIELASFEHAMFIHRLIMELDNKYSSIRA